LADENDIISLSDVAFSYRSDDGEGKETVTKAVDGVSLKIERGSYVAVTGSNGSGKSTLAKLIDLLETPDKGRIVIWGKDSAESGNFWEIRRRCACVFQNPDNQIVGTIVEEDTAFGPENLGIPNPELRERVDTALKETGLYELREREAASLSGGQKQKLAIAGALAMRPEVLILDEATAMLDPICRDEFLELVEKMREEKHLTLITITHDMAEAARCDRIIVMNKGQVAIDGTPAEVFSSGKLGRCGLKQPESFALCYQIAMICGEEILPSDLESEDKLIKRIIKMMPRMVSAYIPDTDEPKEEIKDDIIMSIKGLSYSYDGTTDAISDINLDVRKGEVLGIAGASGCGKTTLISHLNAIIRPQKGDIEIKTKDKVLRCSNKKDMALIRKTVGLVFQYPEYQLFEETVYKDIAYGLTRLKVPEKEHRDLVLEAAKKVGLPEDVLEKSPFELSGGQKRRVAMAGVLVMHPDILVLDEPASGLDPRGRDEMFKMIRDLKKSGTTIILVSHNMDEAARNCDRVCAIKDGRVVKTASPDEFFTNEEDISAAGLDIPVLTRFAGKLERAISAEQPGIDFGKPEFDSYKQAAAIVRAVRKGVKGRA
jgi:energy-coupling factor transport system ATP-binding protein